MSLIKKQKKELYELIDILPEKEIVVVRRFLQFLTKGIIPEYEKEPELTEEEIKASETGWEEYLQGEARPWEEVEKELANE